MNHQRWIIAAVAAVVLLTAGFIVVKGKKSPVSAKDIQTNSSVNQLLEEASKYESDGEKLKLKDTYAKIVTDFPDYEKIEDIQQKLGSLNIDIITSNTQTPQTLMYEVKPGDSLGKLGKEFNTPKELIKKSNHLSSDVIRVGQILRIWKAPFHIVIDKSQNILELKSGDELIKIYHVSTGENNSTPTGVYKIASKIPNPVWFKAGGAPVPPESPDNQLGSRWMGFDTNPHYGIHGTVDPSKIGQQATAGCVRLRNPEVEELFDIVPIGTQVTIKD
jgi:lipoprotein-anchoring transpeptidase ErfK/SrfK